MSTTRIRLAFVGALALIGGCISTRAVQAPGVNLSQYHSFAFRAGADTTLDRTPTGAIVRASITRELAEKGIYPAREGQTPDFYVAPQLVMREQIGSYGYGYGWGWGWGGWGGGWGGPAGVYEYTEGTLIVDFIDPRTNNSFWRGTASSVVGNPDNPSRKNMNKSVAKMMDKYPVQLTPGPTRM